MSNKERTSRSGYIKILAHVSVLLTMVAWGSSFLSTKVLMVDGGFTPVEVYVYRFAFAYLILLAFTWRHIKSKNWKDELQLMLCGVCAGSIYFVTENYALKFTSTGNVSLLGSISPLFTTALLAIIYKIKIAPGVVIGSIVAFAGVACVVFSSGEGLEISPKGDMLALAASLSWAIYTVGVRRLNPIYSTFFITRKLFFYGVISALPLLLIQDAPYHFHELFDTTHPMYLANFLFLGLFCSLAAYLVLNEGMKILGPVTASNYLYLQPLVTMVAAYFIFGETITPMGYLGCGLIIGGLVVSDKLKITRLPFQRQ